MTDEALARPRLRLAFFGDANNVHMRRWIGYFADRDHEVLLMVPVNVSIRPGLHENVRVDRFWPFSSRGRVPPLSYARARRSIRRALRAFQPDVVNGHYLNPNGWHAWMSGCHPYVITAWGSDIFVTRRWPNSTLGRLALRSADRVMVNSAALGRGAVAMGAREDSLQMVQWGVDLDRFSPGDDPTGMRRRLGLQGRRVVLAPRALSGIYRPEVVVKAVRKLPDDVSLVMLAGRSDPADVASVEELAASLGLAERLIMIADLSDAEMPDLLRLADVVVSVPFSDSTSSAILESMASGCQIVATDLPSVREWLGQLEPGSLVPVDDVNATAAAISRALARSARERAELGSAARRIVADRADASRSLAAVEDAYYELSARVRGRLPSC
ncbi:MAG: glycosyltransferase [Candidatus Limnocylindrales bacterium]|jgi:glycosyltransferase involved in cell wall biosynthesis